MRRLRFLLVLIPLIAIPLAALTQAAAWRGLLAGGICMGVFVVEISATIGRRAWARTALAKGDRQHSYDVVASMLRSRVKATLLFWAVGILGAAFALAVSVLPLGIGVSLAAVAAVVLFVLGFRIWSPRGTQGVRDMQRETS